MLLFDYSYCKSYKKPGILLLNVTPCNSIEDISHFYSLIIHFLSPAPTTLNTMKSDHMFSGFAESSICILLEYSPHSHPFLPSVITQIEHLLNRYLQQHRPSTPKFTIGIFGDQVSFWQNLVGWLLYGGNSICIINSRNLMLEYQTDILSTLRATSPLPG